MLIFTLLFKDLRSKDILIPKKPEAEPKFLSIP